MSTKDNLENMAKNTWLAGLGSINSSKDALGKSIEAAQEKSNNLYNELLARGEKIQRKIEDKKDEIQAKGKKLLGIGLNDSQTKKLAQLNATVDELTSAVVKLIEKRNAQAKAKKVAPKVTKKTATKTTTKAAPKASAKTAPKTAAKSTPKAAVKTAPKLVAKSAPKAASKPASKPVVKAAVKAVEKINPKAVSKAATKTTPKAQDTKSVADSASSQTPKNDN